MALGIACAATGNKEALGLIESMKNDPNNNVRQGALIASAMILVQTEQICPKVKGFRALYRKVCKCFVMCKLYVSLIRSSLTRSRMLEYILEQFMHRELWMLLAGI